MEDTAYRAIAIVGLGAVLPDAVDVAAFWENIKQGRYSITEVTPERWDPALYYDPDPSAPDKTYSKIGGWVREHVWDPVKWKLPIPPRVVEGMDEGQKWAISCTRAALLDYGFPERPLDLDRTAVILGNAMAGEKHYFSSLRIYFPEFARELEQSASFATLPPAMQRDIRRELHERIAKRLPVVTEDTMPGELSNCIAGRIANLFNIHGPNYVTDAACASAMAAITAAAEGLIQRDYDVAITGGIDRNMGATSFVKFCKIGALSATGSRPYAEGADGFVMGEGAAIFLLKRLADAERDGDRIYAVLRGMGGSSDGKGKGITAPNPIGQKFAVERAWKNAGLPPATVTLVEGHGTSTKVGDLVETQSLIDVLKDAHLPPASVALGSVKSNIGHLKSSAGAAGFLKATLALHEKVLPPSVNFHRPNPDIDFAHSPVYVNTELKPWTMKNGDVRRAGLSAFGFGGTNFHAVLEEYIPHRITGDVKKSIAVGEIAQAAKETVMTNTKESSGASASAKGAPLKPGFGLSRDKAPLRGALVIGATSDAGLAERLRQVEKAAQAGVAPAPAPPAEADLRAPERIAIDYADAAELADKAGKALKAITSNQPATWKALRAKGIFRGHGPAPKVAFLYTGQGSQYANMLKALRAVEPIIAQTFAEADRVMTPLLGKPLSKFIFVDNGDAAALAKAEEDLRQTAICQPAVLATDLGLTRLLAAYGIEPDMTMGHSLGEYGALVAAGALPFEDALEAVSARGREMTRVAVADNGRMAAISAPLEEIERQLKTIDGYVVIANINSSRQAVIGGASNAVEQAVAMFQKAGHSAIPLPVSHAFHTSIVAPASQPLQRTLERLRLQPPRLPIVANVSGDFYPTAGDVVPQMLHILAQQVAAPVQFIKGLRTLYAAGARVFVETGPKRALQGFVDDVLGEHAEVVSLFTNHPKLGDVAAFNHALCGLYAAGLGRGVPAEAHPSAETTATVAAPKAPARTPSPAAAFSDDRYTALGRMFAEFIERSSQLFQGGRLVESAEPVVISGAALGLPGTAHIFDDENVARILRGEQFIDVVPMRFRQAMVDKHITRLVKSENGGPTFETISNVGEVIKLAARGGAFDLESEYGLSSERVAALDQVTRLAIAAGLDAMRDAGIPLVMRYKKTTKGTQLPDRWGLPEALRDETGVIFASAFPGCNSFAEIISGYHEDHARHDQLALLNDLRNSIAQSNGHANSLRELDRRIEALRAEIEKAPYVFDRRFLFRVLSMGHSQFAEFIGARGPNTQINAACASTTQAVTLAEDWIRAGRCRRVIVISADDITSDQVIDWFAAGFLASGAAATDDVVEEAAIPFDRRRHGMIIGMGAAALVVESPEAVRERGLQPICEVLSAVTANSAFHGTRLDIQHISQVMEDLLAQAEQRSGISRRQIAPETVFVSHETYTPARGGSASAEIHALRQVFGEVADKIVIANTKGFTGHAMATGIEDVVAVKALETGCVPPVANFKEVDPELGALNLSEGGAYPVNYALHLGAGFGSQISMELLRWVPTKDGVRHAPDALGYGYRIVDPAAWNAWLSRMAGTDSAQLEVVHRTLRVRDQRQAARVAEAAQEIRPASKPTQATPAPAVAAEPKVQVKAAAAAASSVASPSRAAVPLPAPVVMRPATPPAPSSVTPAGDAVKERILALVSEKTGYPVDMLDLDLDLEADLGVDTVKQAEVFASVREAYGIQRDETLRLRDFPTLAHVIRFVYDHRPDLRSAVPSQPDAPVQEEVKPAAPSAAAVTPAGDAVKECVLSLVVEKTGYPRDMLDLDLDLEADLGVDTVKQAELFAAIRAIYDIPRDENLKLRDFPTLAHVIRFVYNHRPDLASVTAPAPSAVDASAPIPAAAPPVAEEVAAPVAAVAASVITDHGVKSKVMQIVTEKTGYPQDMLDLDLDLEADLGVDTVKQAEMFAAIRSTYNIPRDENLKLRDFPTLAHVIKFVYDKRPDLATPSVAPPLSRPPLARQGGDLTALAAEPAAAPAPRQATDEEVAAKVLDIVAEKTGYPKDMLDLDLDLEADLGIDTVKQAEMFASVRTAFNIPRDENLKLRDFPTLARVIQFARERRSGAVTVAEQKPAAPPVQPVRRVVASFDATNQIPRRVPVPNLRPPLTLCKTTGVKLGQGSRVVVMPDNGGVADALTLHLQEIGVEVLRIGNVADAEALTNLAKTWLAAGPIQGVFWLPALDHEGSISTMDLPAWRQALRLRLKFLYTTMRVLYAQIAAPGTFLVSATRLGGQHGYDDAGALSPLGGAVAGFTKTYKRERTDALVKAVDFESQRKPAEVADLLLQETLRDPGAVEIGYKSGLRWTVGLREQPAADGRPGLRLDEKTVFVITGAAGSIVSAITADLAAASGGTFYLLDLVPEPDPQNPDLERFVSDKDGLKRDLFARIQARGERATPALVEKELAALERAHAALSAINAVRAAGGTAHYFSVNLTDAENVARVIQQVREHSQRIDVLLHAAGMERSHFLPDKDPREFDLVFDVKSDGWFHLLHAIGDMPLAATVVFSSIAGRFGNGGQTDYASANDLLCKISSSFRSTRPGTRGIAIDWTAWGGIGMATRGSIPKMMELAGIDMLPPEAGVPFIRRELVSGGTRGEVVVAQRLGVMLNEGDGTGGFDATAAILSGPIAGKVAATTLHQGVTVETTLDPAVQPFLFDHQIDGTPVLPGVMGVEAFAEAARCLLPDWRVDAVENVNFLAPFKFYRNEPRTVTVQAVIYPEGDGLLADCRLIGRRTLPNRPEPEEITHFTAGVRLSKKTAAPLTAMAPGAPTGAVIQQGDIYRIYFHGPAYQVVHRAWQDGSRTVGEFTRNLPKNHEPADRPTVMAPRLIELCFQTAGLWEMAAQDKMGLPLHIDRVSVQRSPDTPDCQLYALITPRPDQSGVDAQVVDGDGNVYVQMNGYRTVALPNAVDTKPFKVLTAISLHAAA